MAHALPVSRQIPEARGTVPAMAPMKVIAVKVSDDVADFVDRVHAALAKRAGAGVRLSASDAVRFLLERSRADAEVLELLRVSGDPSKKPRKR